MEMVFLRRGLLFGTRLEVPINVWRFSFYGKIFKFGTRVEK